MHLSPQFVTLQEGGRARRAQRHSTLLRCQRLAGEAARANKWGVASKSGYRPVWLAPPPRSAEVKGAPHTSRIPPVADAAREGARHPRCRRVREAGMRTARRRHYVCAMGQMGLYEDNTRPKGLHRTGASRGGAARPSPVSLTRHRYPPPAPYRKRLPEKILSKISRKAYHPGNCQVPSGMLAVIAIAMSDRSPYTMR